MRIGIITLPLHTNYGGILQAYALQTVLQKLGHEVHVFDYDSLKPIRLPLWKAPLSYAKRILKNIIGIPTPVFYEYRYNKERREIRKHTNRFIELNINRIVIDDFDEIKGDEFDAFVVGSDQVWRPKYFEHMFKTSISNAYLKFAIGWNVKRISYAASFGVDGLEYDKDQISECSRLLQLFDGISVREDSALDLCRDIFKSDAELVLDPTMLLDRADYLSLLGNTSYPSFEGEIMTYILDDSERKGHILDSICKLTGFRSFSVIAKPSSITTNIDDRIQPPVEYWISGFEKSKLVITDSFHACVFAILFKKPFLVIVNKDRGAARFYSLLKMFGLEDRIVPDNGYVSKKLVESPIPENVYERLEEMRFRSLSFINHCLNA